MKQYLIIGLLLITLCRMLQKPNGLLTSYR